MNQNRQIRFLFIMIFLCIPIHKIFSQSLNLVDCNMNDAKISIYSEKVIGVNFLISTGTNTEKFTQYYKKSKIFLTENNNLSSIDKMGYYFYPEQIFSKPKPYKKASYRINIFLKKKQDFVEGTKYIIEFSFGETNHCIEFVWNTDKNFCESIKINQLGYLEKAKIKYAYFGKWLGTAGALSTKKQIFNIINADDKKLVFSKKLELVHSSKIKDEGAYKENFSGENLYRMDISSLTKGKFFIKIPGIGRSLTFEVNNNILNEPLEKTFRVLYHQRCGITLDKEFTKWIRPACKQHSILQVMPEYSFGDSWNLPENIFAEVDKFLEKEIKEFRQVSGGYHDAGDFDRKPEHLIIAEYLLTVFDENKNVFQKRTFNLPESNNSIPDIIDETEFLFSFYKQNQWRDGGIPSGSESNSHPQHQSGNNWLTNSSNETNTYALLSVTGLSCFYYAIGTAHLSKIFYEMNELHKANEYEKSSQEAFEIGTQKFPPQKFNQEIIIATAALRLLDISANPKYLQFIQPIINNIEKLDFLNSTHLWFAYTFCNSNNSFFTESQKENLQHKIQQKWNTILKNDRNGYKHFKHPYSAYGYGTGSVRQMDLLILAWLITKDENLYNWIILSADFCLGANPTGKIMSSGIGNNHIKHPLHLDSMNDNISEPVPGIWIYAPVGKRKHWLQDKFPTYPNFEKVPQLYKIYDTELIPLHSEFTVWETIAPAIMLFGILAE